MTKALTITIAIAMVFTLGVSSTCADLTTFGSSNDGDGGFTLSVQEPDYMSWTTNANDITLTTGGGSGNRYKNSGVLKEFDLDRSVGKSYRITGTMTWTTTGRPNKQGINLFYDNNIADDAYEGINIHYMSRDELFEIREGPNGDVLETVTPDNASDSFSGLDFTYQADIAFINTNGTDEIELTATFIDEFAGDGIFATNTLSTTLTAANYAGEYFGFAGRVDIGSESTVAHKTFEVIPEPATLGVVGLFGVLALLRRRLRINRN